MTAVTNDARGMTRKYPQEINDTMARVLIVDDEAPVQRLISRILDRNGHQCALAGDAREARACMSEQDFDVILCDVNMPGESGIDFIRHALAEHPDTAVIMVTGEDDPALAETALEIGAYGYVIKPFKANELIINVVNALRRRNLEIQSRRHRESLEQTVAMRTSELKEAFNKLRNSMEGIIKTMSLTVESRDPYQPVIRTGWPTWRTPLAWKWDSPEISSRASGWPE